MRLVWISPLLFLALLVAGCDQYLWWDYRDEPYLTALSTSSETEVIRRVASPNKDERQAALRTLAQRAGEARRRGDARPA
ncbi:MAG: hypothetical protein LIP23_02800, partial [Planctomycetes bacterium]|nr:hypothetical protein [Planctomycetota bacterium]